MPPPAAPHAADSDDAVAETMLAKLFPHAASAAREDALALLEEAKALQAKADEAGDGTAVEVELRFGTLLPPEGRFAPGVCLARFRFLCEWMEQSIPPPNSGRWQESVVTQSGDVRCETAAGQEPTRYAKRAVRSIVLASNAASGIAFRLALSTETPVGDEDGAVTSAPTTTPTQLVRVRHRRSFAVNAGNGSYPLAVRIDFTLAWQAPSERAAREWQRRNANTRREIEIEVASASYLRDKAAPYLAASLLGKAVSLFALEEPNGVSITRVVR